MKRYCMSMLLALNSLGLYVCWTGTGWVHAWRKKVVNDDDGAVAVVRRFTF